MAINEENYKEIVSTLTAKKVDLVAVSKLQSPEDILRLHKLGQIDFGENYVQEMVEKHLVLPTDIRWHFIGHLQTNKVKLIASFVHLIQSVDSLKLLQEINKQAKKVNRNIRCLLQVHIAEEETKFGLNEKELDEIMLMSKDFANVTVVGLMGMASFSDDIVKVKNEMKYLHSLFQKYEVNTPAFSVLSMGMSGDYETAIDQGSNMVRIGSLLFGARSKN